CSTDTGIPGGQPSTTHPTAAPCDSPHVVSRNKVPNVLPAIVTGFSGAPRSTAPGRQPGAYVDVLHPGAAGGFEAEVGVFEDQARLGSDTHAFGREEEELRVRLPAVDVFRGADSVEAALQPERVDRLQHQPPDAAGGNRERIAAVIGPHPLDHPRHR